MAKTKLVTIWLNPATDCEKYNVTSGRFLKKIVSRSKNLRSNNENQITFIYVCSVIICFICSDKDKS